MSRTGTDLLAKLITSKLPLLTALSLYAASLFLPAFKCSGPSGGMIGGLVLFIGWLGFVSLDFRWLANPLFLLMMMNLAMGIQPKTVGPMPVVAVVLALGSLAFGVDGVCGDSGSPGRSVSLGWGGYLWVAAILTGSLAYGARAEESQEQASI